MTKKKEEKTFLTKIKMDFKHMVMGGIILNILFLIFGVLIYMNPYITANTVGIIIGISFILFGIFALFEFFMRGSIPIFTYKIFSGILYIILGVFIIANPFKIIKIITFALGIYLIIVAIVKAVEAIKFKKIGYDGWALILVISILLLIFGIFITINPMASMDIITAAGIFIILSCILEICNLFMLYSKALDIEKLFKEI